MRRSWAEDAMAETLDWKLGFPNAKFKMGKGMFVGDEIEGEC